MEKKSSIWVFPTVKNLVSLFYYFLLIVLILFTSMSGLKLLGAQLTNVSLVAKNISVGEEPPGYISVLVAWGQPIPKHDLYQVSLLYT